MVMVSTANSELHSLTNSAHVMRLAGSRFSSMTPTRAYAFSPPSAQSLPNFCPPKAAPSLPAAHSPPAHAPSGGGFCIGQRHSVDIQGIERMYACMYAQEWTNAVHLHAPCARVCVCVRTCVGVQFTIHERRTSSLSSMIIWKARVLVRSSKATTPKRPCI
jgi:hypothetical protein